MTNLLSQKQAAATAKHVIYTREPNERFNYRWLSHMGLHNRTYPQSPTENERLRLAVCIRTVSQDGQGQWLLDRTQCKPKAPKMSEDATAKVWLTASFLQRKYSPKRAQRIDLNCETMGSSDSSSSDFESLNYTKLSRPSPRENDRSEPQADKLFGLNELIISDIDDLSESDNHPQSMGGNQTTLVSLLDDNPPANLASYMLGPNSSEPKLAQSKVLTQLLHVFNDRILTIRTQSINYRSRPHVITLLENHLQLMWPILQRCPGFVTVRLQFGRFYLTDLSSADVDCGNGPHREMADLLRELQALEQERISFSTILSTFRSDADMLITYPTSPWVLLEENTTYQIQCTLDNKNFTVDVDAETFKFSCHGPMSELGCTLVHCVHHAWDLKLAVNHSSNLNASHGYRNIGQAITNSLQIRFVPHSMSQTPR